MYCTLFPLWGIFCQTFGGPGDEEFDKSALLVAADNMEDRFGVTIMAFVVTALVFGVCFYFVHKRYVYIKANTPGEFPESYMPNPLSIYNIGGNFSPHKCFGEYLKLSNQRFENLKPLECFKKESLNSFDSNSCMFTFYIHHEGLFALLHQLVFCRHVPYFWRNHWSRFIGPWSSLCFYYFPLVIYISIGYFSCNRSCTSYVTFKLTIERFIYELLQLVKSLGLPFSM